MKTGQIFQLYDSRVRYPLELTRVPKMGYSIGNAELTRSGSICLFLKIDEVNYALTCQHVVMSSGDPFAPGNGKEVIVQPSKVDLKEDRDKLNERLANEQTVLDNIKASKMKFENGEGLEPKGYEKKVALLEKQIQSYLNDKVVMESGITEVSLPFGTLTHAPGIMPHPVTNFRRDWALVKLSTDRFQSLPPNIVSYSSYLIKCLLTL